MHLPNVGWDMTATSQPDADPDTRGQHSLERVVGGVELAVKFAHYEDLEKVVHAGRGVGWAPDVDIESRDWESAGW